MSALRIDCVMSPDFSKSHFALFRLPVGFDLDVAALEQTYRDLQREVHPDRFANAPDAEKRIAAQWAMQVNEAYRTLKSPLARGRYLLSLNGIDTEEESNTAMPVAFLIQQMDWREAVVAARNAHDDRALEKLAKDKRSEERVLFDRLAAQLSNVATMREARDTVRKLRFLEKLGEEIDLAGEAMES
jgi:molecular chaperone HscB